MKTKIRFLLLALACFAGVHQLSAQGTAFTYQGRLNNGGSPASGVYDFRFKLYVDPFGNTQVGTSYLTNAVPTTNGLFVTTIDFGAGIFTGTTNWLEVDVRTNGGGGYTILNPFQELTPTPYAIFAETASNLSGTLSAAQLGGTILNSSLPASPNFSGTVTAASGFAGDGTGVTNVNAALLGGLAASNYWQTGGNNVAPGQFLGSTNNQPVEFWVNGQRALRLEPNTNGLPNVIGGGTNNSIATGVYAAAIAGGTANTILADLYNSADAVIGGGDKNTNAALQGFIGGGRQNVIQSNAYGATISGGIQNVIQSDNPSSSYSGAVIGGGEDNNNSGSFAVIGGGLFNTIGSNSDYSFIGGGYDNFISTNSDYSFIGVGGFNVIGAESSYSIIVGGSDNEIQSNSDNSTVVGGGGNIIESGSYESIIGGGSGNTIFANDSIIGGGDENNIQTNSDNSAIGGGTANTIQLSCYNSVISGGSGNTIVFDCPNSTIDGGSTNRIGVDNDVTNAFVAGGSGNDADGNDAFAAGQNASALNKNSFVWGDGSAATASTANDSVTMRASGGYRFFTGAGTGGAALLAGQTSWSVLSDRNAKKNFQPVDTVAVLDKLATIPMQQWNYKWEKDTDVPNIGPMAQDFKHTFYPGRDDKSINTLEFDGVELAAIQGLNQKLELQGKDKDTEIQNLKQQNDSLAERLNELEATVKQLAAQK
jgi:hypothetical protein